MCKYFLRGYIVMAVKKTTITDVAKLAQSSPTTVSRVMNDVDYPVRSELRERILAAAKKLNYIPNAAARHLRKDISPDIGVIIPNITNLFYPQTILGIESTLRDSGYNMLLFNTLRSKQRENECLRMLCERQVRGVIISTVDNNIDSYNRYTELGMQFVLLDQKLDGASCPSLNFDSRRGARMAVRHFIENGHRRIAFATTPLTRYTRREIHKGYVDALVEAGLGRGDNYVFEAGEELEGGDANYEVDAGAKLAEQIIKSGCDATAVLCVNDMLAFGVIKAFARHGIRVPEDVSVIGFDDIPFARVFLPSLTTIKYPSYETGRFAAMLIMENMAESGERMMINVKMDPQLVERDTVRDLNK